MRMTGALGALSLLLLTGCSAEAGAEAEAEPQPEQTSSLPQLEADQSDQELAQDLVDSLNVWTHTGGEEVRDQWNPGDGEEALDQVAEQVAEKYRDQFSQALLTDDFGANAGEDGVTVDAIVSQHAMTLRCAPDCDASDDGPSEGSDIRQTLSGEAETVAESPRTISFVMRETADPEPSHWTGTSGIEAVAVFEQDGDVLRVESLNPAG